MFFHLIERIHGTLSCGKIYVGGSRSLGFQRPISVCPAREIVQPCLQEGQSKGQHPEFLFHVKAWSPGGLLHPDWLLDLHGCVFPDWAEHENKQGEHGSPLERGSPSQRELLFCSLQIILSWTWEEPGAFPK